MNRKRRSLRFRITAGALVVVVAALSVAGVAITREVEEAMTAQIDGALRADADYALRSVGKGNQAPPAQGPNGLYVQIVNRASGAVMGLTPQGPGQRSLLGPGQRDGEIVTVTDPSRGALRSLAVALPGADGVSLVLARSLHSVTAVGATLARLVIGLIIVGSALAGALIWWVVGRALRPVEGMRQTVEELSASDLSSRLDPPGTRDELDRLANTLNELLGRLENAVSSERRFIADASHDLRTPIAGLRVLLETDRDDPATMRRTRADALARIDELQELLDQLLQLSTVDRAKTPPTGPVDLDDLVLTQARQLRLVSDLEVDTSQVSGGQVAGSDLELGRVIANLASNASRYARAKVAFTVRGSGSEVELLVDDDGPGIPPEHRERVFERFATLDDARAGPGSGPGLGLAIVIGIVEAHGGTVRVTEAPLGGARIAVRLPAYVPGADAHAPVEGAEIAFR